MIFVQLWQAYKWIQEPMLFQAEDFDYTLAIAFPPTTPHPNLFLYGFLKHYVLNLGNHKVNPRW